MGRTWWYEESPRRKRRSWVLLVLLVLLVAAGYLLWTNRFDIFSRAKSPGELAYVGEAVDVPGSEEGAVLRVTLLEVVDPAQVTDPFVSLPEDERYVAFRLRVQNVGSIGLYLDTPRFGAAVLDTQGNEHSATLGGQAEPMLPNSLLLAPGDSSEGFITLQVPKHAQLAKLRFTLDPFRGTAGEWSLQQREP